MKNWWYYHKWYVICGLIVLGIFIDVVGNALGLWTKKPDFQIAYVGQAELPPDTVAALEQAFASLSSDFNGDGTVLIQVNQYLDTQNIDNDAAYFQVASEISLVGDISTCQSYFFLTDQPELFQQKYHLLAAPDGSCPAGTDFSTQDKVLSWADCPALSSQDLGSYSGYVLGQEITGDNQELLSRLYLGRRCFHSDDRTKNADQCSELWERLLKTQ